MNATSHTFGENLIKQTHVRWMMCTNTCVQLKKNLRNKFTPLHVMPLLPMIIRNGSVSVKES